MFRSAGGRQEVKKAFSRYGTLFTLTFRIHGLRGGLGIFSRKASEENVKINSRKIPNISENSIPCIFTNSIASSPGITVHHDCFKSLVGLKRLSRVQNEF